MRLIEQGFLLPILIILTISIANVFSGITECMKEKSFLEAISLDFLDNILSKYNIKYFFPNKFKNLDKKILTKLSIDKNNNISGIKDSLIEVAKYNLPEFISKFSLKSIKLCLYNTTQNFILLLFLVILSPICLLTYFLKYPDTNIISLIVIQFLSLSILLFLIIRIFISDKHTQKNINYFKLQAYMPVEHHVYDQPPWNIHNELANLYKNIDGIIEKKTRLLFLKIIYFIALPLSLITLPALGVLSYQELVIYVICFSLTLSLCFNFYYIDKNSHIKQYKKLAWPFQNIEFDKLNFNKEPSQNWGINNNKLYLKDDVSKNIFSTIVATYPKAKLFAFNDTNKENDTLQLEIYIILYPEKFVHFYYNKGNLRAVQVGKLTESFFVREWHLTEYYESGSLTAIKDGDSVYGDSYISYINEENIIKEIKE